jgi:hypothetical protein
MTSFWDMVGTADVMDSDRTIEIIRKCSNRGVFKEILRRIGVVISYVRHNPTYRKCELIIDATFRLRSDWLEYKGWQVKAIQVDMMVETTSGKQVFASHFYIVVNQTGQIVEVYDLQ